MGATVMRELTDAEVFGTSAPAAPVRPPQRGVPRGIRNNNPGNIEDGGFARSIPGYQGSDGRFAIFDSMDAGTGAQAKLLQNYGRKGVNTLEGVVNRWAPPKENDTGAYVRFVAQKTGLDPRAPLDLNDENVTRALAAAMAEHENGQPVGATKEMSDAEVFGSPERISTSKSGGVTVDRIPQRPAQAAPVPQRAPKQGVGELAASGFMQPFRDLGNMVTARQDKLKARAMNPPKLGDFANDLMGDVGDSAKMLGGILGIAAAPAQAAVRPAAAAVQNTFGNPTQAPQLTMTGGRPSLTAPRQLSGVEGRGAIEGAINTALSGARPAPVRGPKVAAPQPMPLEDLQKASDAAWTKVDASGYRFPQQDLTATAADVRKLVDDAGPELYPEATKIAGRVEALAKRGQLTPAQANRLRSQVGEKLLTPGSTEASVGAEIKARIDTLIDTANDPALAEARDLYARLMKVKEVSKRIESGDLAQETAGTGGNQNAARQKLRPLIDPKSPQRMRNATKDEVAAIRKVTKGTPTQNMARLLTAFDPTAGKLQALLSTGAAGVSGGTSLAMMPIGMAAKMAEAGIAKKNIQALLDLMSTGGVKPGRAPAPSVGGPYAPLTGPTRLLGAGVVGGPLLQSLVERPRSKSTAKAAAKERRR